MGIESRSIPVGTGPYQLSKYVPRSRIELVANPKYRGFTWNFKSTRFELGNRLVRGDGQGKKNAANWQSQRQYD